MSKVFSAKRKKANFTYEFLDGTTVEVTTNSLSSKEQSEVVSSKTNNPSELIEKYQSIIRKQLAGADTQLVEKIILEQFEDGDIIEFSNSLAGLIRESTEKK